MYSYLHTMSRCAVVDDAISLRPFCNTHLAKYVDFALAVIVATELKMLIDAFNG